ncbi:MAG: succinylglutamate desuccinylase/aspartoacylase family protein [Clostridia bacterium]|nr:succinylglutamate desuccinylase/aspartoacylase family protein [Clostridia bacterium]
MNKKIIYEIKGLYRDDFRVTGFEFGEGEKSVCIVGSSRGNEVQQIYCCSRLIQKMKQLEAEGRILPGHKILIIPSVNPYSVNIQKRFWSTDNTDINRMFPGYNLGETTQRIADGVFREIKDYKYGIQFTSFYMPGDFVPHVRYMDEGYTKREDAEKFGLKYIVERTVRPYDTATLNYNWQVWDTVAFSLYTDTTEHISGTGAGQAVLAVMNFLANNGIIKYDAVGTKKSRTIKDTELVSVRTSESGFYEPIVKAGEEVKTGQALANIIDPYEGYIRETLYAPVEGIVFFQHNAPLTYANTAVIKIIEN